MLLGAVAVLTSACTTTDAVATSDGAEVGHALTDEPTASPVLDSAVVAPTPPATPLTAAPSTMPVAPTATPPTPPTPPPATATAAAVRDVSAALETIRKLHDVPGLVAVTVAGDAGDVVVAQGASGVRRRGGAERITVDDRMHLGSCTKAMTATLCALLVRDGKLAWTDRPADAFSSDVPSIDPGWKDATLEMLLRHRGGAPNQLNAGGLWARLFAHGGPARDARMALVRGVLARAPVAPPGTKFEYSNAGFAIAGAMAERAADAAWEDLARTRLFEPLKMTSAGFGAPGRADDAVVGEPRGHRATGTPVDPGPAADNPDAIGPAGKVHASLPDWARFVALHLRRGRGFDGDLAAIDFDRLQTPPAGGGAAMGWIVAERPWAKGSAAGDHGRVLTHGGSNTFWYCVAWLAPERGFAVLAATNQGGDAAAKACDAAAAALISDHLAAERSR